MVGDPLELFQKQRHRGLPRKTILFRVLALCPSWRNSGSPFSRVSVIGGNLKTRRVLNFWICNQSPSHAGHRTGHSWWQQSIRTKQVILGERPAAFFPGPINSFENNYLFVVAYVGFWFRRLCMYWSVHQMLAVAWSLLKTMGGSPKNCAWCICWLNHGGMERACSLGVAMVFGLRRAVHGWANFTVNACAHAVGWLYMTLPTVGFLNPIGRDFSKGFRSRCLLACDSVDARYQGRPILLATEDTRGWSWSNFTKKCQQENDQCHKLRTQTQHQVTYCSILDTALPMHKVAWLLRNTMTQKPPEDLKKQKH